MTTIKNYGKLFIGVKLDIKEAAKKLNLSERHLRRLIKVGAIPANKVKVKKVVEVEAWEIPNDVVEAAYGAIDEVARHENFGEWMVKKAKELGLTHQELSRRTKLPMVTLATVAQMPNYLSAEDTEIEERIVKVLLRADIERRCRHV